MRHRELRQADYRAGWIAPYKAPHSCLHFALRLNLRLSGNRGHHHLCVKIFRARRCDVLNGGCYRFSDILFRQDLRRGFI